MKTEIVLQLVVAAAAAAFVLSAEAAMYKWTDKQGNVHYTQEPPPEGESKEITGPSRVAAPAANKGEQKKGANEKGDAKTAENKPPLTPEQQEIYSRNCEAARGNLELYKAARRVQQPDGEIVDMNDERRQQKMQAAEEQVKRFCQ